MRVVAGFAVVASSALLLTGCTFLPMPVPTPTPTPTASGDGVLRIGDMTPLGGPLAGTAAAQAAGIELAVREINEQGGVLGFPIEVWHRDAGDADPAKTEASFTQLLELNVDVIIAPASADVMDVLLPLAKKAGVLVVAPANADTAPATANTAPVVPDDAFALALRSSDPNLSELSYGAESYDLTTALALSTVFLGDDGAVSLSFGLSHVQGPGITCASFGACVSVLNTEPAISYRGPAGQFAYDFATGTVVFGAPKSASPTGSSTPSPTKTAKK
jgi:hypothetical protein